jgi:hypothetical protein
MPFTNNTFTVLNEIGNGYACNNQLPPLIGADLDDIATGLTTVATTLAQNPAQVIPVTTITTAASFDIVLGTQINTYRKFSIIITDLLQTTNGDLTLQCSGDGGVTFDSTSNAYTWFYQYTRNDGVQLHSFNETTATAALIGWGSSDPKYTSDLTIDCYHLNGTTNYKKFNVNGTLGNNNDLYVAQFGAAYWSVTTAVNALRFLDDNAGLITCKYSVYGWI